MPSAIDEVWRYVMGAPKKAHGKFALYTLKTKRWARFSIYPRADARAPRPGLKDPIDREGRFAGAGVYGSLGQRLWDAKAPWGYLGAITPGTHELKIAGERTQLLVPMTSRAELVTILTWFVERLKAERWPPNGVALWQLGLCRGCYRPKCATPAPAPPYPECAACREKRIEGERQGKAPVHDDIDDELPPNVYPFPR